MKHLLQKGATIDKATPLFRASQEVVQHLLKEGATTDKTMNDGSTPLYFALQNGHLKVVEVLLQKGATIDKTGKD